MASKAQKKLKKQKARERETRKQILARREELRAPARAERDLRRKIKKLKRVTKIQNQLGDKSIWTDDQLLGLNDKALSQLERNVQILKALEEEYAKENAQKKELNEKLEAQGLHTLESKLNHLHEDLLRHQAEQALTPVSHSGCKFSSSEGDVAEVSVVKAPGFESEEISSDG